MQFDNRESPVLPAMSYADSAGAHAMDDDIHRKFERSAFNYQNVAEDDEGYSTASPREFSLHFLEVSLFNSGINSWEKTTSLLRRSAAQAKGLKTEKEHPVWLALVRHAWAAPSPEAAEALFEGTQLARPIDHSSWSGYPDTLKFEALLYALSQSPDVPKRLSTVRGLKGFFRSPAFQTAAVISACGYYDAEGRTEPFLHCASLLKKVNSGLYNLKGEHFPGFFFRAAFIRTQEYLKRGEPAKAQKLLDKAWVAATKLPVAKHCERIRYVAMDRLYALRVSVVGANGDTVKLTAVHRDWKVYLQERLRILDGDAR